MQSNHPLLPKVNRAIRNAIEFGLIEFWQRKYDKKKVTTVFMGNSDEIPVVKLDNILLAFCAIWSGWIAGVIYLFLERWLYVYVQQENRSAILVILEKSINDERYIGAFLPELPFFKIGDNTSLKQ